MQNSGIDTNLRAVSVVPGKRTGQVTTIWASGANGVILRTTDSGKNWERLHVPDGDSLDFRGMQAFDENNAYIMSSGDGDQSRIYRTVDAGKTWDLQYAGKRKGFFLDAIACTSAANCFALSDPVQGKFRMLHTENGNNWKEMPNAGMPAALAKEGVFAASNSSLLLYGEREIYFGTGGPAARVFHSTDLGKTWTVVETPIRSGTAPRGIFSLARSGNTIVAVGGDYTKPEQAEGVATYSLDGGKTWTLAAPAPAGYRSAVAKYSGGFVAVGPTGAEVSKDGIAWTPAGNLNLNAMAFAGDEGWAAGAKGVVARYMDKTKP